MYTPSPQEIQASGDIDFSNAKPMPLPSADAPPGGPVLDGGAIERDGLPGAAPGNPGASNPKRGSAASSLSNEDVDEIDELLSNDEAEPQEFGTSNHPYTTSRVDIFSNNESKSWPYRPTGKLYFQIGTANYVCSASLIKKGVIVTAAHCVANFGKSAFYHNWVFVPALYDTTQPYGSWTGASAWVMTSYFNGTDSCYQRGVICKNDVAVIRLAPHTTGAAFPGGYTGWYGYGWNGYGFSATNLALINQLGYPVSHDSEIRCKERIHRALSVQRIPEIQSGVHE